MAHGASSFTEPRASSQVIVHTCPTLSNEPTLICPIATTRVTPSTSSIARTIGSEASRLRSLASRSNFPVGDGRLSMFAYTTNTIRRTATDVADTPRRDSAPDRDILDPATGARVWSTGCFPNPATAIRDNPSRPTTLKNGPAVSSHGARVGSASGAMNTAVGPATMPAAERYVRYEGGLRSLGSVPTGSRPARRIIRTTLTSPTKTTTRGRARASVTGRARSLAQYEFPASVNYSNDDMTTA